MLRQLTRLNALETGLWDLQVRVAILEGNGGTRPVTKDDRAKFPAAMATRSRRNERAARFRKPGPSVVLGVSPIEGNSTDRRA